MRDPHIGANLRNLWLPGDWPWHGVKRQHILLQSLR